MFGSCPKRAAFHTREVDVSCRYTSTEQRCPKCGGSSRRVISLPAVIFKGSGFYSTDNRKGQAGDNGGSGSGASDDHGKSHDGGESKGSKEPKEPKESKAEATTAD